MRHGSVVVATPIAAEGMNLIHEKNCLIAETADEFVTSIFAILRDSNYAARLARHAYETVITHFSVHKAQQVLASSLLKARPETRCPSIDIS